MLSTRHVTVRFTVKEAKALLVMAGSGDYNNSDDMPEITRPSNRAESKIRTALGLNPLPSQVEGASLELYDERAVKLVRDALQQKRSERHEAAWQLLRLGSSHEKYLLAREDVERLDQIIAQFGN